MDTIDITRKIEENAALIIDNLSYESIDVYNFLKSEFQKGDITRNYLFQFVFRSFYRIDNAGLSTEFKVAYFELLEQYRNKINIDIEEVLMKLYVVKNLKGQPTLQFSFVTKLLNMINDSNPIYDSHIGKHFSMRRPAYKDLAKSIDTYLDYFETLELTYKEIINGKLLPITFTLFDSKFKNYKLSEIKKIDFIFWSAGQLTELNKRND